MSGRGPGITFTNPCQHGFLRNVREGLIFPRVPGATASLQKSVAAEELISRLPFSPPPSFLPQAFLALEELRKRESLSEEQLLVAEKLISCNPNVWHACVVRIRPCLPPATGVPGPGGAAQECVAIRGAAAGSREAHLVQPQMFDMFVLFVCPLVPQAFLALEELRKSASPSEEQLLVAEKLTSCSLKSAQECVAIGGAATGSREAHLVQPQMFDMFVLFVCPLVPQAFLALEELRKSASPSEEQLLAAEKLISEAFSIIDRSVKVNAIHENKGARRKARLSRAKRATLVSLGWYTPEPAAA
ncbi:unnamed protein product [Closterium sp. NIES-65]|nr:unnamed protein product [Closterium sp. NIES-65]